jgi:hypothetical protein
MVNIRGPPLLIATDDAPEASMLILLNDNVFDLLRDPRAYPLPDELSLVRIDASVDFHLDRHTRRDSDVLHWLRGMNEGGRRPPELRKSPPRGKQPEEGRRGGASSGSRGRQDSASLRENGGAGDFFREGSYDIPLSRSAVLTIYSLPYYSTKGTCRNGQ